MSGLSDYRLTIGIEEEMFLVSAGSLDCVADLPYGFRREAESRLKDHFQREMTASNQNGDDVLSARSKGK
jgi:gamma-glutamyl:cysteine ligase YbdK (ATP-grasp superfamily)